MFHVKFAVVVVVDTKDNWPGAGHVGAGAIVIK